uniref:Ion-translocating oxidoreductase complex subunit G n=1 Tax=uncultured Methanosarcinales archaeon TaxID=183757 RepID=A0A7H1KNH9_9EURY|nr:ion-translocating oxidoreductase complex subunit G [uncultured Methanosarcinales archaeon]
MAETKDSTVMILLKLTLIAAVAAVVLTATYGVTQEQLAKLAEAAGGPDKQLLEMGVVPDATKFKAVGGGEICYEAYDGGDLIGYGAMAEVQGMQDILTLAVGVNTDFVVTGVVVVSQKETPGIGDKIKKDEGFVAQFAGVGLDGLKLSDDGGEIDGISGATISSRYVTDGVVEIIGKMQQEVS